MSPESRRRLFWVTVYAIAMGWVETAVVVYLRLLYYPNGFSFPIHMIPWNVGAVELVREGATLLMLLAVAILAGRHGIERFGYFMYAFGIWDIVYYIGLYLSIHWPESLSTWDLLFLLPVPWVGPVLAPVLVSLVMIIACLLIVRQRDRGRPLRPSLWMWALEILFGLIIIFSFVIDYPTAFSAGVPDRFRWELFLAGYLPGVVLFGYAWWRAEHRKP